MEQRRGWPPGGGTRGFTLVEVLVALLLLAVLSGLAWRALDAMLRTREITQASIERTARLQTALAQWEQDLAQIQDSGRIVPALDFDGQNLRLTRRHPEGLQVVVWRVAEGRWTRWAATPARSLAELREAWRRGQQPLLQQQVLTVLEGVQGWQLAYFWDNAWANALSSGDAPPVKDTPPPPAPGASAPPAANDGAAPLPRGVRLQLDFAAGWSGPLTREIALVGGG
jgi:general secretion pathway protein J